MSALSIFESPAICFLLSTQAKDFALGDEFNGVFEGSNLYCGIKLWDFK